MGQGFTRLHRDKWDDPMLQEKGKIFSRFEAWLYIENKLASGVAQNGLKRGEFVASIRYLSKTWNWSRSKVLRFLEDLQKGDDPWIKDRRHQMGHFVGHFIICKYETSNPTRDTLWDIKRDNINKGLINKGKEIKDSRLPSDDGESVSPKILFKIFQEENQELPQVKELTENLLGKCRSRINQARRKGCLERYLSDFRSAVKKAQQTPFLCGEGENGWKASFDWFVANHRNAYKILEGNYDNLPRRGKNPDLYVGASKDYNKPTEDPTAWTMKKWVRWARINGIDSALSLMKASGVDSFGIGTLETEIQKAEESDKVVNL